MKSINQIKELTELILQKQKQKQNNSNQNHQKHFIVAISGIDASGKGYISQKIKQELSDRNKTVFLENLDGWLNLPSIRFNDRNPAEHFYKNAFRWQQLKDNILIPYAQNQNIDCQVLYLEETWQDFEKREVKIKDYEILILEGIFLFNGDLSPLFDLKIWINCSFETALERALNRNQEGLSTLDIIKAYNEIFFPAQKIHFQQDRPQQKADIIFDNN